MTALTKPCVAAVLLGGLSTAFAGAVVSGGSVSVPTPPPASGGLFDNLGASVELGYDTHYFFRGALVSEQNVWGQVALSVPLVDKLALGLSAWYTSSTDISYQELDLTAGLTYDAGFAKFGVGYTHYEFFDGKFFDGRAGEGFGLSGAEEVGVTVGVPVGPVNLSAGYYYDFETDGSYIEAGIDAPIAVTDNFSIVPAALISYGFDYYTAEDGFQHVKVGLSTPIKLTANAVLTPYVAYNIPLDTYDDFYDDEIYGGVKITVSF